MSTPPPLGWTWEGDAMRPIKRFAAEADRRYVIGQNYLMDEVRSRSPASHSHQFAWLKDAWLTLPESAGDEFPTPDHLRRFALIQAGFYNETRIDCGSNAAALRVASTMRSDNSYAEVVVRGPLVVRRVAKSQNHREMDREEFQRSKTALMETVAEMLGVAPADLVKAQAA